MFPLDDQTTETLCPHPYKEPYPHKSAALTAMRGLAKRENARPHKGLHPYRCVVGHWHLGRRKR